MVVDFDCVFLFWFGLICLVCGFDLICLGLVGGFVVWGGFALGWC